MAARLKVFVTSDGLTDYVVATTSKAKALAAWGSHLDLFKTGHASQTDDPDLVKAGFAHPGEVLRRPSGTRGELARLKPARRPPVPTRPSNAARKKVADLEKSLETLEAAHAKAAARLKSQQAALARKVEALETDHAARRRRIEASLKAARRALG